MSDLLIIAVQSDIAVKINFDDAVFSIFIFKNEKSKI